MNGKRLIIGFLLFLGLFTVGLIYTQFFAYYQRSGPVTSIRIGERSVPVADYQGIDSRSSPLKLRGCFRMDPSLTAGAPVASKPTPLVAPFWFRCFDAGQIDADLASGLARAYVTAPGQPSGFDTMIAVYPDGRAFLWRQLAAEFTD